MENKTCMICGCKDLPTNKLRSRLIDKYGDICLLCELFKAEELEVIQLVEENYKKYGKKDYDSLSNRVYYNPKTDNYHFYGDGQLAQMKEKEGKVYANRVEYVEYLKSIGLI